MCIRDRHISTNWFIRNFKLYMKISPAQYILSLRMVNAQSLLENTEDVYKRQQGNSGLMTGYV